MFTCTMGKGFHMKFPNGWIISVQWGPSNYCDREWVNDVDWMKTRACDIRMKSVNAECAVFDPAGDMVRFPGSGEDTVRGHMDADQVFSLMEWVKNR